MDPTHRPITVNRIMMEENIFDPSNANTPRESRSHTATMRFPQTRSAWFAHISTFTVLCLVVVQAVLGVLANSLCLMADAARQLADHLEQYKYDHTTVPAARVREIILMAIPMVGLIILSVVFVVNASNRAATLDFQVNNVFLIIGTVLAIFTNVIQIANHVYEWRYEKRVTRPWTETRGNRLFHVIVNHSLPLVLVAATILIVMNSEWRLADSIGTYIATFVIICNTASASRRCYNEYCQLDHGDYEPL